MNKTFAPRIAYLRENMDVLTLMAVQAFGFVYAVTICAYYALRFPAN